MYRANFVSKDEAIKALDVAENFVRKTVDLLYFIIRTYTVILMEQSSFQTRV